MAESGMRSVRQVRKPADCDEGKCGNRADDRGNRQGPEHADILHQECEDKRRRRREHQSDRQYLSLSPPVTFTPEEDERQSFLDDAAQPGTKAKDHREHQLRTAPWR